MGKHKVFISYHHANDQYYKNALEKMNEEHEIFVNRSVSLGDIDEDEAPQKIREIIRDKYLRDTSVLVAALLDDGLARGYADAEIGGWLQERLQLIHASSLTALTDITPRPQVVYLDPMFPHKQKSALVKKEMRVFQSLVGPDLDADGLLAPARQLATKRVVVKRPDYAPPLADVATPNAVVTKGHRFDIYAGTPE